MDLLTERVPSYHSYLYDGSNAHEIQTACNQLLVGTTGDEVLIECSVDNDDGTPMIAHGTWYVIGPVWDGYGPAGDARVLRLTQDQVGARFGQDTSGE